MNKKIGLFLPYFWYCLTVLPHSEMDKRLREVKGLLTTPTTSDVGYLFNVAIDYEQCFGTLKGQL